MHIKSKTKRRIIILLCVVFAAAAGVLYVYIRDTSYEMVEEGISLEEAISAVQNDDRYLIVETQLGATGAEYTIVYGEYEGADVELGGNSPSRSLGNTFSFVTQNRFLVLKGEEHNVFNRGVDFGLAYPEIYTVDVVSWKIIKPIQRSYHFRNEYEPSNNGKKSRWFAPKDYLDAFDVEQGDYVIKKSTETP